MPEPSAQPRRGRLLHRLGAVARTFWPSLLPEPVPLHRCERCSSDAVCPMDWDEVDAERWEIELRCGECGHWRTTVAGNRDAAVFETRLGAQTARIEAALERLDRERMVAEVEQLAHALQHDLIDAGDFAR